MEANEKKPACEEITNDVLFEYNSGGLEEGLRRAVELHLERCQSCRRRAEEVSLITTALGESARESGDVPVPERVDKAVFATIEEVSDRRVRSLRIRRTLRYLIPAAACVLVALFAWFFFTRSAAYRFARSERELVYAPSTRREAPTETVPEAPLAVPAADLVRRLEEQIKNEKERSERYAEELARADAMIEQLNEKATSLEAELAAERQETTTLAQQLKKREEDAKKSEELIVELRRAVNEGDKILAEYDKKFKELREDYSRQGNEINSLVATIDDLRKKYREMKEIQIKEIAEAEELLREHKKLCSAYEALLKSTTVHGDLNQDRKSDLSDAMIIVEKLLSVGKVPYTAEGDANEDGAVDVGDALMILNNALAE